MFWNAYIPFSVLVNLSNWLLFHPSPPADITHWSYSFTNLTIEYLHKQLNKNFYNQNKELKTCLNIKGNYKGEKVKFILKLRELEYTEQQALHPS